IHFKLFSLLTGDGTQDIILSPQYDEFYAKNVHKNFGDIGTTIKDLMDTFNLKRKGQKEITSIADMKEFVEGYPAFKKLSGTVSKHLSVVGHLSNLVARYNLLEISRLEQELVVYPDHSSVVQRLKLLVTDPKVRKHDVLRLILLYALRYERSSSSQVEDLCRMTGDSRVAPAVKGFLRYGGAAHRSLDLFGTQDPVRITQRLFKGLKEDLIVFVVGGVTYEESLAVASFNALHLKPSTGSGNQSNPRPRVILGGTNVLNSKAFLEQIIPTLFSEMERE
ncbi:unnamed protein product, partial [Cyprideis torosa]